MSIWMHAKYKGLVEEVEFALRPGAATFVEAQFDGTGLWKVSATYTGDEDPKAIALDSLYVMAVVYEQQMGFAWTPYFAKVMERLLVRFWTKRLDDLRASPADEVCRLEPVSR